MGIKVKVTKSLDSYIKRTERRQQAAVVETARLVKNNQFRTLLINVKEWTGNLAGSISVFVAKYEALIGPNTAVADYAAKIEDGFPYDTAFTGYHYVRNSLRQVQGKFISLIEKSIR